ncbi:MAG: aminoglycoside phosphotransferase family protein [Pseudomonadota bacterium]
MDQRQMSTRSRRIEITEMTVRHLIDSQFPKFSNLPIKPVLHNGWDNQTFRLGRNFLIRLPSAQHYASQVEKEQYWLPRLANYLPLPIPEPIAIGEPSNEYPYPWSIYKWLPGNPALYTHQIHKNNVAIDLARFLSALQKIPVDPKTSPLPDMHNFYRGGDLKIYDEETRESLDTLKNKIDVCSALKIWDTAITTQWLHPPVWIHGDVSAGNLLLKRGRLSAVIDFGMLAVGDPACDLSVAWTFFQGESRHLFYSNLDLDRNTWLRGLAWALWKASIIASGKSSTNAFAINEAYSILNELLSDSIIKCSLIDKNRNKK